VTRDRTRKVNRMPRFTRRDLIHSGGAALAVTSAAAMHHRAWGAQPGAATPASPSGLDTIALNQFIADAVRQYNVPGAAVAVVQDGVPVLVTGYGVRDITGHDVVDADTVFQLASNTKPMTAFVLGTLVDEGLVGWDTPIIDVLPELQLHDVYATHHVTLRDVLAHRSGLPAFVGDIVGHLGYDRAEMLRRLRYVQPGASFREVASYSNLGFFIAGEVVTRLTGAPWEEAMHERLLEPTGMSRSGASLADLPADGNVSANHGKIDGEIQVVEPDDHGVHGSAGSAISTANDMARWMQMLLDGGAVRGQQVIQPETVVEMFAPSMVAETTFTEAPPIDAHAGFSYGMGWGNFHYHGYEVLEKGGALAGIRTVVCLVPQLNAGIAVLANLNLTLLPEAVRAFALEQWLGAPGYDMQQDIADSAAIVDQLFTPVAFPENPVPPSVPLENLAGTYADQLHGNVEILVVGDALRLEAGPARWPAEMRHFNRDTFMLDWGTVTNVPDQTTFTIGPDGIAVAFENEGLGRFDRVGED
jgi:CubicO group peptidase (beta-lactamase class C family)